MVQNKADSKMLVVPIAVALISGICVILSSALTLATPFAEKLAGNVSPQFIGISVVIIVMGFFIVVGVSAYLITREINRQAQKSNEKIALAESRAESQPEKARPAWDLARITLEAYFNRNLSQITYIFWLSVVVMIVGFGIIIWGIMQSLQFPNSLAPASLSVLAGVITEFIGATFLFIYRSTIQQAINYSKTLERINSVGMAMQILDTMPDDAEKNNLKSSTKANLVELLVTQAHTIKEVDVAKEKES